MPNLTGQSLGRYHLLEQLGEGGMATVYKAYDTRLERDVAVKIIRREVFSPILLDHMLKRFEREAKSLAKLSHPNIVHVHDYGEHEGAPYLVMEYLPGGTLKQRIGRPMPWREAIWILSPIAEALAYAHEHNIIHRDIKPANILLTEKGQPMLSDFGIAKILESEETSTLTGAGVGVGTPEYMAPEQWSGQAGLQSDIYSLGVVLYELVTGRKPYTAETPAAILLKQANDPLPRPGQFVRDLPEVIEKILLKALAKKPEDRYETMGAFARALNDLDEPISNVKRRRRKVKPARLVPTLLGVVFFLMCIVGAFIWGKDILSALFPNAVFFSTPAPEFGIGSTYVRPADGMTMVYVPEGEFTMGSNDGDMDERPVHVVYLDAYWIDQIEVTNAM